MATARPRATPHLATPPNRNLNAPSALVPQQLSCALCLSTARLLPRGVLSLQPHSWPSLCFLLPPFSAVSVRQEPLWPLPQLSLATFGHRALFCLVCNHSSWESCPPHPQLRVPTVPVSTCLFLNFRPKYQLPRGDYRPCLAGPSDSPCPRPLPPMDRSQLAVGFANQLLPTEWG